MPTKTKTKKEPRTPEQVVADLAPAYGEYDKGKKSKDKLRVEFFEAITRELAASGSQAEDLVECEAPNPEAAQEFAMKKRPGWIIDDWRESPDHEGIYEIIVRENPEFQPFTIEYDGKVWGRQVVAGSTFVDDERLKEADEDLWFEVTAFPNEDFVLDLVYETGMDAELVEDHISQVAARHGIGRQLKSLKDLDPETLAKLQPYIFEGKPTVKLPAPKKAES